MVASTLLHYEILELLGAGGMGEVYRARDTVLGREVAVKLLRTEVAQDSERLARFRQEARLLASLSHPNIATIHGLEESEGTHFLVMELVEGDTLANTIAAGPLPLDRVVPLFRQIADALAAAHRKEIVHRDLKPANIKITPEDRVKLLDFGLAKAVADETVSLDLSESPTLPITGTAVGMLLGTAPYMSPEQARGQPVDHRTDIWAFGCCLYEALSGETAFRGETAADTIARILEREPDWRRLPANTPDGIRQLLRRCLEKNLAQRLQTIGDLRLDVSEAETAPESTPREQRSVAALPFLNLSSDPHNEYFADGITEDVIAQLSKIGGLKVISRTSVMPFKDRQQSLREIAATLGVETVLEGSVRRAGPRVRIVAQLIDAETDRHLWAETYDRQLDDIFAIQSDVALHIASALEAELSPAVRGRIERRPTDDLDAYHLYLEGRHCTFRFTDEGIRKGLELYSRALQRDPDYALAHVGVALAYALIGLGVTSSVLRSSEAYARAKEAALRALEIDGDLGDAHAIVGFVKLVSEFDWSGAESELSRALELSPGRSMTHGFRALLLSALERHEEAIEASKTARELDPLAAVHSSDLATKLLRAGRYEDAVAEARHLLELEPRFPMAHSTLGWAYLRQGRTEEGLAELRHAVEVAPGNTMLLAQLGQAYAEAEMTDKARDILQQLLALAEQQYVSPYHMAYIHTGLGEHDRALDCLEHAHAERASGLYGIKGSFLFAALRQHPRFKALLERMNLA